MSQPQCNHHHHDPQERNESLTTTIVHLSVRQQSIQRKRRVRFGVAEFFEHPIIAGDNPACTEGVPLTIGWECVGTFTVDSVALHKERRAQLRRERSSLHLYHRGCGGGGDALIQERLRLSATVRQDILLNLGYTKQELNRWLKSVNAARAQRRKTLESLPSSESLAGASEKTRKNIFHKVMVSLSKKRQERRAKQWNQKMEHLSLLSSRDESSSKMVKTPSTTSTESLDSLMSSDSSIPVVPVENE